jgi:hypothetical protein
MTRRTQHGQVLVIGAVAMVVLIGIAGLVIDLGFSWMLRRAEQNAVDPATIAAARYITEPGGYGAMQESACFFARENGFFASATSNDFTGSGCVPSNDPDGAVLSVNWPPTAAPAEFRNTSHVEVTLSRDRQTFFSRIFGFGTMTVSTSAVAANGTGGISGGQLVSLDPTSCGAGQIRGNGVVDVEGSVYVRSDGSGPPSCVGTFDDACSGSDGGFRFNGSNARLVTPQLSVRGTCGQNANPYPNNCSPPSSCGMAEGAADISDPYAGIFPPIDIATMDPPSGSVPVTSCDGPTDNGCTFAGGPGSIYTLNPGVYYGGWTVSRELRLEPGIYYIAGGGIQVTGNGRLVTNGATPGDGEGRILIYNTDGPDCASAGGRKCQGTVLIEGQGGFQARSHNTDPYKGLLIWQAEGTSKTFPTDTDFSNDKVRIAGVGDLAFFGLIYAPKSLVELQGNGVGTGTAGVQVLSWRFDIGGNANLDMPLDPNELPGRIVKGLVH